MLTLSTIQSQFHFAQTMCLVQFVITVTALKQCVWKWPKRYFHYRLLYHGLYVCVKYLWWMLYSHKEHSNSISSPSLSGEFVHNIDSSWCKYIQFAFHEIHALALTNGIRRAKKKTKQWSDWGKYTKRYKMYTGWKANTIMHESTPQWVPWPAPHTHTPSLGGVRQHQQPCAVTHTTACPASISQFTMIPLSS